MPAKKGGRPDRTVHTEPGENTKYINHTMRMWGWQKPDMTKVEEVDRRIGEYFAICAEDDMKPSVAGLAMAFNVERSTLWKWVHGVESNYVSDSARTSLKKAYQLLNVQMEIYMQNGKINPVAGIFLMKNNMGYKDQQEVVLKPDNPLGNSASPEELQERYIQAIDSGNSNDSDS